MSVETLYKICTAFEISADYLVFGKPNMSLGSPANRLLDEVPNKNMEEYMQLIKLNLSLVNASFNELHKRFIYFLYRISANWNQFLSIQYTFILKN